MPHWLIKSAVQRTISFLPRSHWWNELLQRKITKSIELTEARFEQRLGDARLYLDRLFEFGTPDPRRFSVLELGTGWFPIIPTALYLCGAAEIWTIDIVSHLNPQRVRATLELFIKYAERGLLQKCIPRLLPERLAKLKEICASAVAENVDSILGALNIHALVRDAQHTGLSQEAIDLFISSSVLEYIPKGVLANMLAEFKRIARPGAVHNHFINLGDEYAHFDRSITRFNFLKYPDWQWKFLDAPFTRKSRLRISEYRELFARAGWKIVREENIDGSAQDLERIKLAPQFQKFSKEDLLVIKSWLIAKG